MKSALDQIRARLNAARTRSVPPFPTLSEYHELADDTDRLIRALELLIKQRDDLLNNKFMAGQQVKMKKSLNSVIENVLNGNDDAQAKE